MDDLTIAMCVHSLVISCRYTNTGNQDQQLDGLLQYEDEGWNSADHEDDFSPPDEFLENNVIGGEVVHGENVANML